MKAVDRRAHAAPAPLERELGLVRAAIEMVASGGSPRVVVAGISFGELLMEPACRLATEAGVRLLTLRRADLHGSDLSVEAIRR